MGVLILIFLALTGGAPPAGDGATAGGTPTVTSPDTTGDTTTMEGGDSVRKSPVG